MKILICGGRDFPHECRVWDWIRENVHPKQDIVIHGGCPTGADKFADDACNFFQIATLVFKPDWRNGPKGGPERNQRMIDEGRPDRVVAFWNGGSPGTFDMLKRASKAGIRYTILIQDGCDQYVANALIELERQGRLF